MNKRNPDKTNRLYWKGLRVQWHHQEGPMCLIERVLDAVKKQCGISAVESSLSPLKLIQTAKEASLGYEKPCKLLYIYGDYRFLKHFS